MWFALLKTLKQQLLEHGFEVPVIDRPDLHSEAAAGDRAFGGAEPRHAIRQGSSQEPGKPGNLPREEGVW